MQIAGSTCVWLPPVTECSYPCMKSQLAPTKPESARRSGGRGRPSASAPIASSTAFSSGLSTPPSRAYQSHARPYGLSSTGAEWSYTSEMRHSRSSRPHENDQKQR